MVNYRNQKTGADEGGPRPGPPWLVRVRDLMTSPPITAEPTATVKDIAQILLERDIRCVPVVDIGDKLVGVVSEADLVCREGYPTPRHHYLAGIIDDAVVEHRQHWTARAQGLTAGELMTTDVVTCAPEEPVAMVTRRMLRHEVRTLPVVDDGRVVGVLSRHDLLGLFDRPDPEIRKGVAGVLDDLWWARDSHVQAVVRDGVVVLTGTVRFQGDATVMTRIIQQVPGVIEVIDHLTWQHSDRHRYPHPI